MLGAAAASLIVSIAQVLGYEAGIKIVARWGPMLSQEAAGKLWGDLVATAQRVCAKIKAGVSEADAAEPWPQSMAIILNPDGSIPIANPLVPPDMGPM